MGPGPGFVSSSRVQKRFTARIVRLDTFGTLVRSPQGRSKNANEQVVGHNPIAPPEIRTSELLAGTSVWLR